MIGYCWCGWVGGKSGRKRGGEDDFWFLVGAAVRVAGFIPGLRKKREKRSLEGKAKGKGFEG